MFICVCELLTKRQCDDSFLHTSNLHLWWIRVTYIQFQSNRWSVWISRYSLRASSSRSLVSVLSLSLSLPSQLWHHISTFSFIHARAFYVKWKCAYHFMSWRQTFKFNRPVLMQHLIQERVCEISFRLLGTIVSRWCLDTAKMWKMGRQMPFYSFYNDIWTTSLLWQFNVRLLSYNAARTSSLYQMVKVGSQIIKLRLEVHKNGFAGCCGNRFFICHVISVSHMAGWLDVRARFRKFMSAPAHHTYNVLQWMTSLIQFFNQVRVSIITMTDILGTKMPKGQMGK